MKSKIFVASTASLLAFALLAVLTGPPVEAQNKPTVNADAHQLRYRFVDLSSLGGPNAGINCCGIIPPILNNRGVAVGSADTSLPNPNFAIENPIFFLSCCPPGPDPFINVAVDWHHSFPTNLGALPGGYNSGAGAIAANGTIVGSSETGDIDPLLGVVEAHPTLWSHGEIIDLGSFGGGEGLGIQANNRGQAVGFAQNSTSDPYGYFGFGTQSRAFLWQKGALQDLGTLGTGNDAQAVFINDAGQIAGVSYTNTTAVTNSGFYCPQDDPVQHPFLWENEQMLDLGALGGNCAAPAAINNRGQVAGNSDVADVTALPHAFLWSQETGMKDLGTLGGTFSQADGLTDAGAVVGASTLAGDQVFHAFLWRNDEMTDLGILSGDCYSGAYAINSSGQIVGDSFSCDFVTTPFLWENGQMINLQAFVPQTSGFTLAEPSFINDRGEIVGYGFLSNGDENAFLLIPCAQDETEGCEDETANASSAQVASSTSRQRPTAEHSHSREEIISALRTRFGHRNNRFGMVPK